MPSKKTQTKKKPLTRKRASSKSKTVKRKTPIKSKPKKKPSSNLKRKTSRTKSLKRKTQKEKPKVLNKTSNPFKEHKKRTIYTLILIEAFLAFMLIFLVYSFAETYHTTGIWQLQDLFGIGVVLGAIAILYLVLQKKFSSVLEAQQLTSFLAKEKIKSLKDFRELTLLLVDIIFIVVIIIAIWAYLDPDVSIVQWQEMGIFPPWTTVGNLIIFGIIMLILYYLYSITKKIRF